MRRLLGIMCFLLAIIAAYFCQPLIKENTDLMQMIVTVLTVFAGFLVAVVTIIGETSLVYNRNWRQLELKRKGVEEKLIKHAYLFVLYLLGIAAAFLIIALKNVTLFPDEIRRYIEYGCLFLGFFAFFVTFGLPFSIVRTQMKRVDGVIDALRQKATSQDHTSDGESAS